MCVYIYIYIYINININIIIKTVLGPQGKRSTSCAECAALVMNRARTCAKYDPVIRSHRSTCIGDNYQCVCVILSKLLTQRSSMKPQRLSSHGAFPAKLCQGHHESFRHRSGQLHGSCTCIAASTLIPQRHQDGGR